MSSEDDESNKPISSLRETLLDEYASREIRLQAIDDLEKRDSSDIVAILGQALIELDSTDKTNAIVRTRCISILEQPSLLVDAAPYFSQVINDPDNNVRSGANYALGTSLEFLHTQLQTNNPAILAKKQKIIQALGTETIGNILLNDERPVIRQSAASILGAAGDVASIPFLQKTLDKDTEFSVLWSAISALAAINSVEVVPILGKTLIHDANETLQVKAANALAQIAHPEGIPYLTQALIKGKNKTIKESAKSALLQIPNWQVKTKQVIIILQDSNLERAIIDDAVIVQAIKPTETENTHQYLLSNYLIEQAIGKNARMTAILAALIIASTDGSMSVAGERINNYRDTNSISESKLRTLRIEIGGNIALAPLQNILTANMEDYFLKPIADLNHQTYQMWINTIDQARLGFRVRIIMSVITFTVGIGLVVSSFLWAVLGNLSIESLVGPGVAFGAGIITMLLTVYRGPLKEIHRSVNDLGIASAAFIAYIHRVMEISHTFSFYYLNQQINFDRMKESGELIQNAMKSTIGALQNNSFKDENPLTAVYPINEQP